VVGKDQVARGREMHWIRIDRYYEAISTIGHAPSAGACMHCENARRAGVPVSARYTAAKGSEIVYNRCVGTDTAEQLP